MIKKFFVITAIVISLISCGSHSHDNHDEHNHSHANTEDHNHQHDTNHEHQHDADCEHEHLSYDDNHSHDVINNEELESNMVIFTSEQKSKINFEVTKAVIEPVYQIIRTSAQILPTQDNEIRITAATNGVVELSDMSLVEGSDIKKGQMIFSIDNNNMAEGSLEVRKQEIMAEYERAKADYERKKELADERIVSQKDLQEALASYIKAEKKYRNMSENFPDGKQVTKSPLTGYVKNIAIKNGDYVEAGQLIMTVADNSKVYIKADLQPKYYSVLKDIVSANIKNINDDKVYSLEDLSGRLLSYGKSTGTGNPLIPVTFEIENNGTFIPGAFVDLYIKTVGDEEGVMVPNSAIVEEMGSHFVFVQTGHDLYEKRPVVRGVTDAEKTQIIRGVDNGETIVTKGAIFIKLAQGSGKLDPHAGHVH